MTATTSIRKVLFELFGRPRQLRIRSEKTGSHPIVIIHRRLNTYCKLFHTTAFSLIGKTVIRQCSHVNVMNILRNVTNSIKGGLTGPQKTSPEYNAHLETLNRPRISPALVRADRLRVAVVVLLDFPENAKSQRNIVRVRHTSIFIITESTTYTYLLPNLTYPLPYTSDLNIMVSPPPCPTFYQTGVTPDILDIALISNFHTNLYHKVLNELDSDHVPPIKWEIFKENINKILKPNRKYSNTNDINSGIIHLTESIKSAIDLALAPPNYKKSHNYNMPIPSHIQNPIKEKHKARRIWQTHRSPAVKKRLNQLTRRRETIPPLKNGLAKYETNIEKCEIFAQHFESCFTTDENHTNQNEVVNLEQRNIENQPIVNPISLYDTAIITQNQTLESSIRDLQSSLDELSLWFSKWKLILNPTKSEAKIFTLRKYINLTLLQINNKEINWNNKDDTVKYLGLHLDKKLSWKIHINKKLNQGYTRLRILYPLLNHSSTIQMKCSLLLYTAIIRPLVTYACPVWASASKTKIKKLQTLQNKFLRIALKAPWFMRNKQLHNDTGIPHLSTWITQQFKNFHEKLHKVDGARHYIIGKRSTNLRLKPRLPQDILLDPNEDTSTSDSDLD
ncbi:Hypothetical protein CINCED_3A000701 [Cinara cedri]|uniref:Endonuclease/exonuclease/phosphatase n=1 Tax=Cinara cedri TaxID=506608 RepID=A0A5E4N6P9_9HEMI|nr:Hypothetical protein CINCED_3A000701 [Cinara cedri]